MTFTDKRVINVKVEDRRNYKSELFWKTRADAFDRGNLFSDLPVNLRRKFRELCPIAL